jgi:hypothetical protein
MCIYTISSHIACHTHVLSSAWARQNHDSHTHTQCSLKAMAALLAPAKLSVLAPVCGFLQESVFCVLHDVHVFAIVLPAHKRTHQVWNYWPTCGTHKNVSWSSLPCRSGATAAPTCIATPSPRSSPPPTTPLQSLKTAQKYPTSTCQGTMQTSPTSWLCVR